MSALNLIGAALHPSDPDYPDAPLDLKEGICCITGITGLTAPRVDVLGKSFTNLDILAAPNSDRVGINAYLAMKYKWQRMSCWYVDTAFERVDKKRIRAIVFNPPKDREWALYVTTGYKKHGGLYTPVNSCGRAFVRFEMLQVDCSDTKKAYEWWGVMLAAQKNNISRTVQETLIVEPHVIKIIGLKKWLEFEAWAKDKYKSALYSLLVYLLPSAEELKSGVI